MSSRVPPDGPGWEANVNAAIDEAHTLTWTHVVDQQWRLDGNCPRCGHRFGQYFDFEVVLSRDVAADVFAQPSAETVKTQVVCLCEPAAPHRAETKGCGAGKGLTIALRRPKRERPGGGD